ncbi:hypothetical protein U0070_025252, partial [Myodes glareolus]
QSGGTAAVPLSASILEEKLRITARKATLSKSLTRKPDLVKSFFTDSTEQQRPHLLRRLAPGLCLCHGVWCSPEQMAAGQEARVWVPLPVRRVPLLLHHDGVQRVHLCELAHVWGLMIVAWPPAEAQVLLFCAIRDPVAPESGGPSRAAASVSPVLSTGLHSCPGGLGSPCHLLCSRVP